MREKRRNVKCTYNRCKQVKIYYANDQSFTLTMKVYSSFIIRPKMC